MSCAGESCKVGFHAFSCQGEGCKVRACVPSVARA